jgi:hypothetical protein
VAFSYCYPPLIYYLTERSLFKKCPPPTGKSLKKALIAMGSVGLQNTEVTSLLCTGCPPKSTLYRNYPIVIIWMPEQWALCWTQECVNTIEFCLNSVLNNNRINFYRGYFFGDTLYRGSWRGGGGPNPISHLKFWQNPSPSWIFIRNPSPSYWNPSQ